MIIFNQFLWISEKMIEHIAGQKRYLLLYDWWNVSIKKTNGKLQSFQNKFIEKIPGQNLKSLCQSKRPLCSKGMVELRFIDWAPMKTFWEKLFKLRRMICKTWIWANWGGNWSNWSSRTIWKWDTKKYCVAFRMMSQTFSIGFCVSASWKLNFFDLLKLYFFPKSFIWAPGSPKYLICA